MSHRIRIARAEHKFSVAHMTVFPDGTKERLHGHNYSIAVEVEVADVAFEHMVPFASIKALIADICATFKERVLIAQQNKFLQIVRDSSIEIELTLCGQRYVFPRSDVLLLPIDNVSAEALAAYVASIVRPNLQVNPQNLRSLEVTVEESPGQGATTHLDFASLPAKLL